jgi:ATP-dependent Clp protease ATP-binding subunit ClpC
VGARSASHDCNVFEGYTEDARQAVVLAQAEVRTMGHGVIGTGHLLLGVLRAGKTGLASQPVGARFGLDVERLRREVIAIVGAGEPGAAMEGQIPFGPEGKRALEEAIHAAVGAGHRWIRPEHLLLGLLSGSETVAPLALARAGVSIEDVSAAIHEQWSKESSSRPAAQPLPAAPAIPQPGSAPNGLPDDGVVPGVVAVQLIVGRSDTMAVFVPQLSVYPSGIEWPFVFLARDPIPVRFPLPGAPPMNLASPAGMRGEPQTPCELTIRYEDGSEAVVTMGGPQGESALQVRPIGGSGGPGRFDMRFFVSPLPDTGPVTVTCHWPETGIPVTETQIDGKLILEAAGRAQQLWRSE